MTSRCRPPPPTPVLASLGGKASRETHSNDGADGIVSSVAPSGRRLHGPFRKRAVSGPGLGKAAQLESLLGDRRWHLRVWQLRRISLRAEGFACFLPATPWWSKGEIDHSQLDSFRPTNPGRSDKGRTLSAKRKRHLKTFKLYPGSQPAAAGSDGRSGGHSPWGPVTGQVLIFARKGLNDSQALLGLASPLARGSQSETATGSCGLPRWPPRGAVLRAGVEGTEQLLPSDSRWLGGGRLTLGKEVEFASVIDQEPPDLGWS